MTQTFQDDPKRCSSCHELIEDCQCFNEIDNSEYDAFEDDVDDVDDEDYEV